MKPLLPDGTYPVEPERVYSGHSPPGKSTGTDPPHYGPSSSAGDAAQGNQSNSATFETRHMMLIPSDGQLTLGLDGVKDEAIDVVTAYRLGAQLLRELAAMPEDEEPEEPDPA